MEGVCGCVGVDLLYICFCLKSLESQVSGERLKVVFCKWSRVDSETDPTYPASLTSRALLKDVDQRKWDDGGWVVRTHPLPHISIPLVCLCVDILGYIVGVKPQTHVKSVYRYLMTVIFADSVMSWGRWALAWLCDRKTAQVRGVVMEGGCGGCQLCSTTPQSVSALPGSPHYGRLSIKSQIFCHVDSSVTVSCVSVVLVCIVVTGDSLQIPLHHVYPQRKGKTKKDKVVFATPTSSTTLVI